MGGQESTTDEVSNKVPKKNSVGPNSTNRNSGPSYAEAISQNIAPTQSTQKTTTSATDTTIPAIISPSKQGKIDPTQWNVVEWFGNGGFWLNFFVRWIFLVLEEKEISEQNNIKRGLGVIKRETEEIYKAGMIDLNTYKFCSDLIMRCGSIRSSYDANKRNDLLHIIFGYLQVDANFANLLIETTTKMSVEQRVVLRFMVHQNIQARIAFLRTTLKTHETANDMERYHCVMNPYYSEVARERDNAIAERDKAIVECDNAMTERNNLQEAITVVKNSNPDLNDRYGKLLTKIDELNVRNEELNQENFELKDQLKDLNEKIKLNQESIKLKELNEKNKELTRENIKLKEQLDQLSSQKEQDQKALVRDL